jgi:hypothetical protein
VIVVVLSCGWPRVLDFQQLQRFAVTAALQEMAELGIDLRRQGSLKAFETFGNLAEPFHVTVRITATLFVTDDSQAFAKRGGELG